MAVGEGRPTGSRTLRFTGGRFSTERLSDEAFAAAAKSLVAFREAVVELAKAEYEASSKRADADVPSGIRDFRFCVTDLRPGSLEVEVRPDAERAMFDLEDPCIRSADRIESAIAGLGGDGKDGALTELPARVRGLIAKIGDPLDDEEAVSFDSRLGTARLGRHEWEALRRPSSLASVALDLIAGRVLRVSADRARASLSVLGWESSRPTSIYYENPATLEDMRVALTADDETGSLVTVAGWFAWSSRSVKLQGGAIALDRVRVHDEEAAAPMRALLREIDDLEELEDGWYGTDGEPGAAPHPEAVLGARRLAAAFPHYELPYPHVFPGVDGEVAMEWTIGDVEASITFERSRDTATVASLDVVSNEHRYAEGVIVDCAYVRDWLRDLAGQPSR